MPVEEIVLDVIKECERPLMKVDRDIDVEEDMPSAGPSWNYILMKPRTFCLIRNRVSKVYEGALRLVYDDSQDLPFEELLVKGNSVSIHQKISKL